MVEFVKSSNEGFYQVNVILPRDLRLNLKNHLLIAYSVENTICGSAKFENLGNKLGYFIAVQGRDDNSPGTETYPYSMSENVLPNLPQEILNEIKPNFKLMNKRTKRIFDLFGDVPNFKTYTLLEVDLKLKQNRN